MPTIYQPWVQGRSDGGYIGIYTPKISPSKFYGVKMTSERRFNSFIPPPKKKTFIPQNKFLATPLHGWARARPPCLGHGGSWDFQKFDEYWEVSGVGSACASCRLRIHIRLLGGDSCASLLPNPGYAMATVVCTFTIASYHYTVRQRSHMTTSTFQCKINDVMTD